MNVRTTRESAARDCPNDIRSLRNILTLVEGSDELEDPHAVQILLQSIKTREINILVESLN